MKDLATEQVIEVISKEFDLFSKRSFAAMDKLSSNMNNITIDQVQPCVAKAMKNKNIPNITFGYALLAGCFLTINNLIENHKKESK